MTEAKKILGVDMGGTNIRAGLIENGKLVKVLSIPTPANDLCDVILDDLSGLISKFVQESFGAIGIGVPTVVNVEKGIVYNATNIKDWEEVQLKAILEEKFKVPVFINNDANCFVIGEKHFGKAKDFKSVVGLVLGTGLGIGLILNNQTYEGRNCGAGEIGNLPYLEYNYEYYCSGQYFRDELKIPAHEVFLLASEGDSQALKYFETFGFHLGKFLQAIMYAFDPELIVFGGSVSLSFPYFKESMYRSLTDGFIFPNSLKNIKIKVSELQNVAIYGAASLVLEK